MKKLFYILAALSCLTLYAQAPNIQWQKTLGGADSESAESILQTSDGGFITVGNTNPYNSSNILAIKLDSSGNTQWQKSLGGSNDDTVNSVLQFSDGYIISGNSNSNNGDVTGNHGGLDYWIIKLDLSGNIQWQKTLGGTSHEIIFSINKTSDNGYIISGASSSYNGDVTENYGDYDIWIVKLNSSGNIQWQKTLGGINDDFPQQIKQTSNGEYIVVGSSYSNVGNHGDSDIWVVKLNSTGNIQWQKSLGGSGKDVPDNFLQTSDGGYIIAGTSESNDGDVIGNHGGKDTWIVKLDALGSIQWNKSLGGSGEEPGSPLILQANDGGYTILTTTTSNDGDIVGSTPSTTLMVKLNNTGNIQWKNSFNNLGSNNIGEFPASLTQTSDNGYIISINMEDTVTHIYNILVMKLDATGNIVWEKPIHENMITSVKSLEKTTDGGFVLAGYSSGYTYADFLIVKLGYPGTLGLSEVTKSNQILVYPNPAKDVVYLDYLPTGSTISITDMSGKKLFSEKYNGIKASINICQFINGTYIIQAENHGKIILSEKLLINR
ncbi:T9SS type A sorting domain-containing protein [Chryseobacterium luteum]|uniref:T9SS type A sorting domain-containing protein n=1 Tax=Chryseobacterium luteum TaxID=421531 RepID=UPI00068C4286|nr:T9SS type A sorting domain-containing protein [Chryseobacterium luteum]